MKRAYPVFIAECGRDYLVYIPDMNIYTEGNSIINAIEMARDAIGLKGIAFQDDNKEIPEPSDYKNAYKKAKEKTEDFDYTQGMLTMVDINFTEYRKKVDNKMVRRNVTLPNWMNFEAEQLNLNVSKVLQEALADKFKEME